MGLYQIAIDRETHWANVPGSLRASRHLRRFGVTLFAFLNTLIPAAALGGNSPTAASALEQRVEQLRMREPVVIAGAVIAARNLIADFYEGRDFQPAWPRDKARELHALVLASSSHGLDPLDYHGPALARLLATDGPGEGIDAAARDVVLTDALVRYAYHLRFGKANPRETHPEWNFARERIDPTQALAAIVSAPSLTDAVAEYAPRLPAYERLRESLARHRAIEAAGGWGGVAPGPMLKPGMLDARVPSLRARLAASGDLPAADADASSASYDPASGAAVKGFQVRHGLQADGIVGAQTLSALNVGVARRIEQLRINLDRVRWVARDLSRDYLLVDIAGFVARLYIHHQLVWSSRVVVGRPYRSTPAFRATLQSVVINPTWTIPPTILREDILPLVAKDSRYLMRNDMRVLDSAGMEVDPTSIDWSRYRRGVRFPYEIVQAPGPANPLGELKFMLPNPHAVYLHDTPARSLFARPERAFSSGCIRLETAHELATLLLDDVEHWNAEALRAAIAGGETRTLPVKRRVPVLLLYFTADVDERGVTHFHPDLYRRDDQVLAALKAPFRFHPPPQRGHSKR